MAKPKKVSQVSVAQREARTLMGKLQKLIEALGEYNAEIVKISMQGNFDNENSRVLGEREKIVYAQMQSAVKMIIHLETKISHLLVIERNKLFIEDIERRSLTT